MGAGRGAQGSLSSLQTRGHLGWGRQAQPGATAEGSGQCRVGLGAVWVWAHRPSMLASEDTGDMVHLGQMWRQAGHLEVDLLGPGQVA